MCRSNDLILFIMGLRNTINSMYSFNQRESSEKKWMPRFVQFQPFDLDSIQWKSTPHMVDLDTNGWFYPCAVKQRLNEDLFVDLMRRCKVIVIIMLTLLFAFFFSVVSCPHRLRDPLLFFPSSSVGCCPSCSELVGLITRVSEGCHGGQMRVNSE